MHQFLKQSIFKNITFCIYPKELNSKTTLSKLRNAIQRQSGTLLELPLDSNDKIGHPLYQIAVSTEEDDATYSSDIDAIVPLTWIHDCIASRKLLDTSKALPVLKKQKTRNVKFEWKVEVIDSLLTCRVITNDDNDDDYNTTRFNDILALDLDGTLITTSSGRKFARPHEYTTDWKFLTPDLPSIVKSKLLGRYSKLVVFTNQNGISKKKMTISDLKQKIQNVFTKLGLPCEIYFSLSDDLMRKPRIGMATAFNANQNVTYVGDAAGRVNDFSDSDLKFALNAGFEFYTPEAFFYNKKASVHTDVLNNIGSFDPRKVLKPSDDSLNPDLIDILKSDELKIVLLVGSPASGKTHFVKQHLSSSYVHISNDISKSSNTDANVALSNKKSIVVDNTNATVKTRAYWISIASNVGIPIYALVFNRQKKLVLHLNKYRKLRRGDYVPDVAIHTFFKYHSTPTESEGFKQVFEIPLIISGDSQDNLLNTFL